jgi:mannosyltransferase OCH1-like enzyme
MYIIKNTKKSNISNLIVKKNSLDTLFEFTIIYNDDTSFLLNINFLYGEPTLLSFINKNDQNEMIQITINTSSEQIITTPFKLIVDESILKNKIPKIIHQSYTNNVNSHIFSTISTWKEMNINYDYMYWNDDDCYTFIKDNFDTSVLEAYNMLYAGAYKSDIFRLCVLYIYGGIWTDISSLCEVSLDKVINNENLIIVKDTDSVQTRYGNIYQAFIISEAKNNIILYILNFTVNRVINHQEFENNYPQVINQTLGVTGPTIFAMGFNSFINRPVENIINDNEIYFNDNNIKLLKHNPGEIILNDIKIMTTKRADWLKGRTTSHYTTLFLQGYIFKKKVIDVFNNSEYLNVYQIWIQGEYVSNNMYKSIQTIFEYNPNINYKLFTNDTIITLLNEDNEFDNLLNAYKLIKPYAYKSDLARLYILYKYGGVYIDVDFICTHEIITLCNNKELVLCKDIGNTSISNGFMYAEKENLFIKYCIIECIKNIMNKTLDGDLSITGPVFIGKCFFSFYNESGQIPNTINQHPNIKILEYKFNLPLPKGSWINSSRNYYIINGNILHAECRRMNGEWSTNDVIFNINDELNNDDGRIVGNSNFVYNQVNGSGLVYDNDTIFFSSKYETYNNERIILKGNDFGNMYRNNDVYN